MAATDIFIAASPRVVFDVLSDAEAYGYWVVGSKRIRDADPDWPEPGSRFDHTVGVGPVTIRDDTKVEEVARDERLVLHARFRPLGSAEIALRLEPEGSGTRVTMEERPLGGPAARGYGRLAALVLRARNAESLRRLKRLAESRPATAAR